jgi:hypothetical protein
MMFAMAAKPFTQSEWKLINNKLVADSIAYSRINPVLKRMGEYLEALHGKNVDKLPNAEQKAFFARFEHKVNDHMPLCLRLPLP